MAYKEESEQQFMESIVNQARGPARRQMGSQYSGDPGFGPDDDSFGNERSSPMKRSNGFQNIDGADQFDRDQSVTDFSNDLALRNPPAHDEERNPHAEMQQLKRAIEEKERELHELQQEKVKLMRKITGRLE